MLRNTILNNLENTVSNLRELINNIKNEENGESSKTDKNINILDGYNPFDNPFKIDLDNILSTNNSTSEVNNLQEESTDETDNMTEDPPNMKLVPDINPRFVYSEHGITDIIRNALEMSSNGHKSYKTMNEYFLKETMKRPYKLCSSTSNQKNIDLNYHLYIGDVLKMNYINIVNPSPSFKLNKINVDDFSYDTTLFEVKKYYSPEGKYIYKYLIPGYMNVIPLFMYREVGRPIITIDSDNEYECFEIQTSNYVLLEKNRAKIRKNNSIKLLKPMIQKVSYKLKIGENKINFDNMDRMNGFFIKTYNYNIKTSIKSISVNVSGLELFTYEGDELIDYINQLSHDKCYVPFNGNIDFTKYNENSIFSGGMNPNIEIIITSNTDFNIDLFLNGSELIEYYKYNTEDNYYSMRYLNNM
jgi:hypothetical protein